MVRQRVRVKVLGVLVSTVVALFTGSAFAQSEGDRSGRSEGNAAAEEVRPDPLQSEGQTLKAENAIVRGLLRKMEAQQQALVEQVDRLQRRLDGATSGGGSPRGELSQIADVRQPLTTGAGFPEAAATNAGSASAQQPAAAKPEREDHYQDGIVIWQNPEDAKVPFLLKFNNNTQIRYLNSLNSDSTFTDHLGNVRDVHERNDITVNRSMFVFAG